MMNHDHSPVSCEIAAAVFLRLNLLFTSEFSIMLRTLLLAALLLAVNGRHLQSGSVKSKKHASLVKNRQVEQEDNRKQQKQQHIVPVVAAAQFDSNTIKGISCVLGGALAHLAFGSFYCWGNFISYSPLHLRFFDGKYRDGTPPDSLIVMPLSLLSQCLTMPLGAILVKKIGASATLLIGGLLFSSAVFLSSFAKRLSTFLACYSFLIGGGIGIAYTAPMTAGWKWMPQSKGLISGAVLTGFGAGGFVFNLIGTKLVNPKGIDMINGRFPDEIYSNFPIMLRKLAMMYASLAVLAALFVTEPKISSEDKKSEPVAVGVDIIDALKTPQFYLLWLMIFTSASAGLNVASVYKQFAAGSAALAGDGFQSLVGGMGALFNGLGRLFWGILCDKIGFKKSFIILTIIQSGLHLLYPMSASSKTNFLVMHSLCHVMLSGNFALMPPAITRMFGVKNGALIYGLIYSAFGSASIGGMMISKALTAKMGWGGVFKVLASMSFLATLLTTLLQPLASLPSSVV